MSRSPRSPNQGMAHSCRRLTHIEELDGRFPGLLTKIRVLLDQGTNAERAAQILSESFPVRVTKSHVSSFRSKRWRPAKEKAAADFHALEILFQKCGGNRGLDLAAFARVRELLGTSNIKEANSVRLTLLRTRAQDLKEDEFKFKAGQLRPGQPADGQEIDPNAQQKNVLRRIKEIFGLATDEAPEPPAPEVPAAAGDVNA